MPADLGGYGGQAPPPFPPQSLITIDLGEKPATAATVGVPAQLAAGLTGMSNGLKDGVRTGKAYLITAHRLPLSPARPRRQAPLLGARTAHLAWYG